MSTTDAVAHAAPSCGAKARRPQRVQALRAEHLEKALSTEATLGKRRLNPVLRRQQLLQCAIVAFAENGLARATHSHVAKLAGVSVPTIHAYFRSRDDLESAVLDEVEAYLVSLVGGTLAEDGSIHDVLKNLAVQFAEDAIRQPDLIKVWLDWSTGVRAGIWPRYLTLLEQLHAITREIIAKGRDEGILSESLDVESVARLFLGGGHTLALMQFGGAKPEEVNMFAEHLVQSIMNISIAKGALSNTSGKE